MEGAEEVSNRALYAVLEDEIDLIKSRGDEEFRRFQEKKIGEMEKDARGLGRYVKEAMSEVPSEEADKIFEACYISYSMIKYHQQYPLPQG